MEAFDVDKITNFLKNDDMVRQLLSSSSLSLSPPPSAAETEEKTNPKSKQQRCASDPKTLLFRAHDGIIEHVICKYHFFAEATRKISKQRTVITIHDHNQNLFDELVHAIKTNGTLQKRKRDFFYKYQYVFFSGHQKTVVQRDTDSSDSKNFKVDYCLYNIADNSASNNIFLVQPKADIVFSNCALHRFFGSDADILAFFGSYLKKTLEKNGLFCAVFLDFSFLLHQAIITRSGGGDSKDSKGKKKTTAIFRSRYATVRIANELLGYLKKKRKMPSGAVAELLSCTVEYPHFSKLASKTERLIPRTHVERVLADFYAADFEVVHWSGLVEFLEEHNVMTTAEEKEFMNGYVRLFSIAVIRRTSS